MRLYKSTSILVLASLALFAAPQLRAGGNDNMSQRGQFSKDDYKFVCNAARGGIFEVRAGELARSQGLNPLVKQFGERMIRDHSQVDRQLQTLATNKGAGLPTGLSSDQQDKLNDLKQQAGKDFDKNYASTMVSDHQKDLKNFEDEAQNANDPALRAFCKTTVGVLAEHLAAAKQMQSAVDRENQTAGR
jgi:putative membrane protein